MIKRARRAVGRSPHVRAALAHKRRLGRWPNLVRPRTFNEKVLHKCLHDDRPWLTQTADKLTVREYVAESVGPEYLTKVFAATEDSSQIDIARLPSAFVAKANHGSGQKWRWIVPNKDLAELDQLYKAMAKWISEPYQADGYQAECGRLPGPFFTRRVAVITTSHGHGSVATVA